WDATVIDTLADGKVNGITTIGLDDVVYGWRSCSTNTAQFVMLNAQDVLNTLTALVESTLQPYVFATIDGSGQLVGRIKGALIGILQPVFEAGGLTAQYDSTGKMTNPAYTVSVTVASETSINATV